MSAAAPPGTPRATCCARCGANFECGVAMPSCWCQGLPPLDPGVFDASAGCYCPACLASLVRDQAGAAACGSNAKS